MTDQPTTVTLGPDGPPISPVGIGTWAWGDRMMWGYGGNYAEAEIREAFQASLEGGVTWFDTAEVYGLGQSEKFLGRFIREAGAEALIATKFMPFPWRLGKGALRRALRASLKRLGLERIDLYQIHWPLPPVPIETWMDALADAVDDGLVRMVGVSNYSVEQMRRAADALSKRGIRLASNQVEYSLIQRAPERAGLFDLCRDLGVTLIAYSPIGMGMLTGKYTPDAPPKGARARRYSRERLAAIQPLIDLLREIGEAHGGKTSAQVAINWTICKGAVPIPGAKNADQARANAVVMGWRLTVDEVAALDKASEGL